MNSKAKGNAFERQISKSLSLWLTNKTRDDVLYRSQTSGGRATSRKKLGKDTQNQSGDITVAVTDSPIASKFCETFVIECKSYKTLNWWALIKKSSSSEMLEWFTTICNISKDLEKIPILIIKQNNQPILLATNNHLSQKLLIDYAIPPICGFYIDTLATSMCFYEFDTILRIDINDFEKTLNEFCRMT